ncbi:hypothetical protein MKK69_26245 [Methylobacterium sp. J-026]|uniref:hypothetical protein n=1 Tax=Methylobacterium sp. J-026 TaxID=2836624 RepID=UPI001FBBC235|nr:hypothetical protein [Methylobacterium sp. J-026]MCJ2137501.1 hypothetical protein [Methylobacterium sp. J-026]
MTIAILVALLAGALSLGVLSSVAPFRRREEIELDDGGPLDDALFDPAGPVIDLEPRR